MAGTATRLVCFFPLLFWKGLIGKFMIYLPTMLILTLAASLIVAFIMNPVFAVSFMRPEGRQYEKPKSAIFRKPLFWVLIVFGILFNLATWHGVGNFFIFMALLMILNTYVLRGVIHYFQERVLP